MSAPNVTPAVLALRPGAKLSRVDRKALREIGIVVVTVAPEDLVAIQNVQVLPSNEMLRLALETINAPKLNSTFVNDVPTELRASFGRRVIESMLALGELQRKEGAA